MLRLLLLLPLGLARLKASTDDTSFLWAISQVETGGEKHPDLAVSTTGCRGRYQLSSAVWFQYAPIGWPHTDAHDPVKSELIARKHLAYLKARYEPCPDYHLRIALAHDWKYGPHCVHSYKLPYFTDSYATRTWNLYSEHKNN